MLSPSEKVSSDRGLLSLTHSSLSPTHMWTPLSHTHTNDCSPWRSRACQELDLIKDQMSQQSSKEVQLEEEVAFVCVYVGVRVRVRVSRRGGGRGR